MSLQNRVVSAAATSPLVVLIALLPTACSVNPCPANTVALKGEDRCAGSSAVDGTPLDGALAYDGAMRDAPQTQGEAGQKQLSQSDAEADSDALAQDGGLADAGVVNARWPSGKIAICWSAETVARSDFPTLSAVFRAMAISTWPTAAAISFEGFEACSDVTTDTVVVTLRDSDEFTVVDGYQGASAQHALTLGIRRTGVDGSLFPHALGHVLGLADQHAHAACTSPSPTVDGIPSTLPEQGDCRARPLLSSVDRARARAAYGDRVVTARHRDRGSFDGDAIDDLAFVELRETGVAGALVRVHLTGSHGFDAAGSGQWLTLSTTPSELRVGDFDGDGLVDLGLIDAAHTQIEVRLSSGTSFADSNASWQRPLAVGSKVLVGDFDRSGGADLAQIKPDHSLVISLSQRVGMSDWQPWMGAAALMANLEGRHLVGDYNGDGFDDLAFLQPVDVPGAYEKGSIWVHVCDVGGVLRGLPIQWANGADFGGMEGMHYTGNFKGDQWDDLGYFQPQTPNITEAIGALWVDPSTAHSFTSSSIWLLPDATRQVSDLRLIGNFDGALGDDLAYLDPRRMNVQVYFDVEGNDPDWLREQPTWPSMAYDPARVSLAASSFEAQGR